MTKSPHPLRVRQAWAVAAYELRRLLRARHGLARVLVVLLPVFLAGLVCVVRLALSEPGPGGPTLFGQAYTLATDQAALAKMFRLGYLRWIVFLAAVGLFGGLFSGERSERTLHHVFLQPVRREILTLGKYLGAVLLLFTAAAASWFLTTLIWLVPHGLGPALGAILSAQGLGDLASYALVLLLAIVAYGGLFLLAGAVFRSPPLVALVVLAWEGLCAFLPLSFQRFTVFYWLDSLLPLRIPAGSLLAVLAEPAAWPLAVLACLLIGGSAVAATAWRARSMEVAYGATE